MKIHPREAWLMLATASVALFAGTAMLARPKLDDWRDVRRQQAEVRDQIERENRLLQTKESWEKQFSEFTRIIPVFPADKKMDVHWLSIMDELARKHGVSISKRQVQEEKKVGDVYELPIEGREWEGSLDALVHFLFDLQSQGAMLDIRQLLIKPKEQKSDGMLRGRFVLYCAYMREKGAGKEKPAAPPPAAIPSKRQGTEE